MPRIRSLHPGLFTDDRYMALSFPARELLKGIWCESDDQGVFEWRPLTLKARIMPADAIDIEALLSELVAGKFVTRFEHADHSYGAVRNFRKFQRPKKPHSAFLLPAEFRTYVGLSDEEPEPTPDKPPSVPHQFPTKGGKSPQMEDGGGRRSSVPNGTGGKPPPDPVKAMFERCVAILGENNRALVGKARRDYGDPAVLAAVQACEEERPSDPVGFFFGCLRHRPGAKAVHSGGVIPMHPGAGG